MAKKLVITTVGDGFSSNPDDVLTIRSILSDLGYNDPNPDFAYIDSQLDKNIKSFQDDNDLKSDGIIHPGGETEAAMSNALREAVSDDSMGPAVPTSPIEEEQLPGTTAEPPLKPRVPVGAPDKGVPLYPADVPDPNMDGSMVIDPDAGININSGWEI